MSLLCLYYGIFDDHYSIVYTKNKSKKVNGIKMRFASLYEGQGSKRGILEKSGLVC
ncbi:hypothetical protein HMPREF9555_01860 [Selenomonas artemidis F0399]|uniref:Uncharacterized protein n=1 Tax=Selenomonas artemidis F0399 TaxID=749551 RepID=E7N4B7_9FIRM|nr:hypothetical protein HMPREF9555_01860 [Selenomonas artemidis F0399]